MKILLSILASLALIPLALGDSTLTVTLAFDAGISLSPNGDLDAPPSWMSTGPNLLSVIDSRNAKLNCTALGTNIVTIAATSQGNALNSVVTIIVVPIPVKPPATTLGVQVYPLTKPTNAATK